MDKVTFYVHYNWSGNDIKEISNSRPEYMKVINRHFWEVRNELINVLNYKFDEWNKEFDEKYSDSDYLKYICKKQNEVLSAKHDEMFELRSNGEGMIIGDLIGTDSSVYITAYINWNDD